MRALRIKILLTLAGAVALAGCGMVATASAPATRIATSPGDTHERSVTTVQPIPSAVAPTSTTVLTARTTACRASQLSVSLSGATWDGLQGTELFQPIEFANTSAKPCYLQGAPSVAFFYHGAPLAGLTFLGLTGSAQATVDPPGLSYVDGQPDPNTSALDPTTPPKIVLAPGRHALVVLTEGTYTTGAMSVDCPGFRSQVRAIAFTFPGRAGTITATSAGYFQCPHNDYQVSWFTSLAQLAQPAPLVASLHSRVSFRTPPQTVTAS